MSTSAIKKYAIIFAVALLAVYVSENVDAVRKIVKGA